MKNSNGISTIVNVNWNHRIDSTLLAHKMKKKPSSQSHFWFCDLFLPSKFQTHLLRSCPTSPRVTRGIYHFQITNVLILLFHQSNPNPCFKIYFSFFSPIYLVKFKFFITLLLLNSKKKNISCPSLSFYLSNRKLIKILHTSP